MGSRFREKHRYIEAMRLTGKNGRAVRRFIEGRKVSIIAGPYQDIWYVPLNVSRQGERVTARVQGKRMVLGVVGDWVVKTDMEVTVMTDRRFVRKYVAA